MDEQVLVTGILWYDLMMTRFQINTQGRGSMEQELPQPRVRVKMRFHVVTPCDSGIIAFRSTLTFLMDCN